jgi:hypothetical protein
MSRGPDGALQPYKGFLVETMASFAEMKHPDVPLYDILEWEEALDSSDFSPGTETRRAVLFRELHACAIIVVVESFLAVHLDHPIFSGHFFLPPSRHCMCVCVARPPARSVLDQAGATDFGQLLFVRRLCHLARHRHDGLHLLGAVLHARKPWQGRCA